MKKRNLEELLREAQEKTASEAPEIYRDKVLRLARQAMRETGKDCIKIKTDSGEVVFTQEGALTRMFLNNNEVPFEEMAEKITEIDGVGKSNSLLNTGGMLIEKSGVFNNFGQRSVDAALRSARRQMQQIDKASGNIVRALLQILGKSIGAR